MNIERKKIKDLLPQEVNKLKKLTIRPKEDSILFKYLDNQLSYLEHEVYIIKLSNIIAWAVVNPTKHEAYFVSIYVSESFRGCGIAYKLLEEIKKTYSPLCGFPKTDQAIRLFEKCDVRIVKNDLVCRKK